MRATTRGNGDAGLRSLPPGGARVFYIFQEALVPALRERFMESLCEDERARHVRLIRETDRDLFLLAHGMLRYIVGHYGGLAPHALRFERNEHGRPALQGSEAPAALRFNLTHTPGLTACALAMGRDVGVDAENLSRRVDRRSVSARVFSDEERRGLDALSGAAAQERFFLHWTLKEAYVKAMGRGFSLRLRQITTVPGNDDRATLQLKHMDDDPSRWTLRSYRAGAEHQLAVALEATGDAPIEFEEVRFSAA